MRYSRQNKILELVQTNEIDTQEMLCNLLKEAGYDVTQATVSRDVKELQLVKSLTSNGKYVYAQVQGNAPVTERFVNIFKETITSFTPAENIIVVKTLSGCANAAGEAIDSIDFGHIVGSIAGDNTLFLVVDSDKNVKKVLSEFEELMKN